MHDRHGRSCRPGINEAQQPSFPTIYSRRLTRKPDCNVCSSFCSNTQECHPVGKATTRNFFCLCVYPVKPLVGVESAIAQGILYGNFVGSRDLSRLGRRHLASLVPPCLSPGPLDPKVGAPGTLLAIHSVHSLLSLFDGAEVDKKVVVVTGFESLGGVRSKQLADVLTKGRNQG